MHFLITYNFARRLWTKKQVGGGQRRASFKFLFSFFFIFFHTLSIYLKKGEQAKNRQSDVEVLDITL